MKQLLIILKLSILDGVIWLHSARQQFTFIVLPVFLPFFFLMKTAALFFMLSVLMGLILHRVLLRWQKKHPALDLHYPISKKSMLQAKEKKSSCLTIYCPNYITYHFTEICKAEMDEYIQLNHLPLTVHTDNWTFIKSFITN